MVNDIRIRLEKIGLGELADTFEREGIDWSLLREMTHADFRELGIRMGPRMKIAAAIKAESIPPQAIAETSPNKNERVILQEPERRQLTLLFCDLVGSTPLSERLDPEDYLALIEAYHAACGAVVEKNQGRVAQYLGDGILAYFGWPFAHEDDAQRAARAGLEIIPAVTAIEQPETLAVRIGIATGPVVIGLTYSEDAANFPLAVGETPNVAARIQGFAEPNTVTVSEMTNRLLGEAFDIEELGERDIRGISRPEQIFTVTSERNQGSRFDASHPDKLTPLVGREEETDLLMRRWDQAKNGEGQVVLLCGNAGIGKSRIAQALRDRIRTQPHSTIRQQCLPDHEDSAFFPIIHQIEHAAKFSFNDSSDQKLDKIESVFVNKDSDAKKDSDLNEMMSLTARLLSLPTERYSALELSARRQKERIVEMLVNQTIELAAQSPMLLIFEDAHWSDPSTIDALSQLINRLEGERVLLVITYRPAFNPPWTGHGHVTTLTLNRFGRKNSEELIKRSAADQDLPADVIRDISERADGVPLYIEELTKAVMSGDVAIPPTLQAILTARLDSLPDAKEVAQIGACIGREFTYNLLAAVSGLDDEELEGALQRLAQQEIVFSRGFGDDKKYVFKHALFQESAYDSLLKSKRRERHATIAQVLQTQFGHLVDSKPELLARHFEEAQQPANAAPYRLQAAQDAMRRSANNEAIAHIRKGIEDVGAIKEGNLRAQIELKLQSMLALAVTSIEGFAAKEVNSAHNRASDLLRELGDSPDSFPIRWGIATYHLNCGNILANEEVAERMLAQAKSEDDQDLLLVSHSMLTLTRFFRDETEKVPLHLKSCLERYDQDRHGALINQYGFDRKAVALTQAASALWVAGYPDQAVAHEKRAVAAARLAEHPLSLIYVLNAGARVYLWRGEVDQVLRHTSESIELAEQQALPFFVSFAQLYRGLAVALKGDIDSGLMMIEQSLSDYEKGSRLAVPYINSALASLHIQNGKYRKAAELLDDAERRVAKGGERVWEAEICRVRGDLIANKTPQDPLQAEKAYRRACEVAQSRKANGWQLRAAVSLAELWRVQGEQQRACDILTPILEHFQEGLNTVDVKKAKSMLVN